MNLPAISPFALKESSDPADIFKRDNTVSPARQKAPSPNNAEAMEAARDFEALILKQMLTMMRKNIPQSGLLDQSHGHDMYQAMQDEQLAETLADAGGIGIARMLYRQITGQIQTTTGNK